MRLHLPPTLAFGLCPGSLNPPQLCGAFFVKGTLQIRPGEPAVWADKPDLVTGDVYVDDDPSKLLRYPSDFAVFKPRADLLLVGHAHAPGGQPTSSLHVRFSVGQFDKILTVVGEPASLTRGTSVRADQFTEMPLSYEFAYGGAGFERNPIGKGHNRAGGPNLIDPSRPEAREPAGFGPIPISWPQRRALVGSYGGNYVKERWPWFPSDFDWGCFNAAPRDQQLDGYLRGDEDIALEHLHPQHHVWRARLPGVRVRCFLEDQSTTGARRFREVTMRLDTLWIDTDAAKLVLVWRGVAEVRTPKMRELDEVLIVTEPLAEMARPAAEYREALDRTRAVAGSVVAVRPRTPEEQAFDQSFADLDEKMARMDQEFAAVDQDIIAQEAEVARLTAESATHLPPDVTFPNSPPVQSLSETATELTTLLAQLRRAHAEQVQYLDGISSELLEAEAEFQAFDKEMAEVAEELKPPERWTRERVEATGAAGGPIAELDLAGLDLSGLDLSGLDLSRSRLNGATLKGARLRQANLTGADLTGANLAQADMTAATLDDADLTGSVLTDAKLTALSLNHTTLGRLDLAGADLTGSTGEAPDFSNANLAGALLVGVTMPAANFTGGNLANADLTSAELPGGRFRGASAMAIKLSGANIQGLQADKGTDFSGGDFRDADAANAVFDSVTLDGANFSRANLTAAQFEGASLRHVNFDRATLAGAMFDEADLQGAALSSANLLRATLDGADLTGGTARGSNLYEAGFWRATVVELDVRDANRKGTLLE